MVEAIDCLIKLILYLEQVRDVILTRLSSTVPIVVTIAKIDIKQPFKSIDQSLIHDKYMLRTHGFTLGVWRRVWRYQRGNQNPYIEEEQTTLWPKEKLQKDKQLFTKHTYKPKDRVTWTPLTTGGELGCSGRESSTCSTSNTRRVNLVC